MRSGLARKPPMSPRKWKSSESRSKSGTSQRMPIIGSAQLKLRETLPLNPNPPATPAEPLRFAPKCI